MGWDIRLTKDDEAVVVPMHNAGGIMIFCGNHFADISVTYNYRPIYAFGKLHGRTASDTVNELREVVEKNGTERDPDYWSPTPGNVGYIADVLLGWAEQYPDAVWDAT